MDRKPTIYSYRIWTREKLYNVKRNAWHSILTSQDAAILIVENQDTGEENTEYSRIAEGNKQEILSSRQKYIITRENR